MQMVRITLWNCNHNYNWPSELYDFEDNPNESHNLAEDRPCGEARVTLEKLVLDG